MGGNKINLLTSLHLNCKITTGLIGHLQALMLALCQPITAYQINRIFSLIFIKYTLKRDNRPHPTILNYTGSINFSKRKQR